MSGCEPVGATAAGLDHPQSRVPCIWMPKKYREVRRVLIEAGWSVARQRGSHEVWTHPDRTVRVVVAGNASDTVPVGTLGSIRRATSLEQLR